MSWKLAFGLLLAVGALGLGVRMVLMFGGNDAANNPLWIMVSLCILAAAVISWRNQRRLR